MPPRDIERWMWAEAVEALARAERLQRQFFRLGLPEARALWEPPADILETEDELWIIAALPGVGAPQVEITIENGVLIIAGERLAPALKQAAIIHRIEIPQGRFARRIALPPGRFELERRDLVDGILTLSLRKLG
jgi:HSP20 family protein